MYVCGAQSNNRMSLDLLNNLHLCVVGNARNITGLNVVGVKYKCNNNKSATFSSSFALLLLSFTVIAFSNKHEPKYTPGTIFHLLSTARSLTSIYVHIQPQSLCDLLLLLLANKSKLQKQIFALTISSFR